jgi:hypothetical protein
MVRSFEHTNHIFERNFNSGAVAARRIVSYNRKTTAAPASGLEKWASILVAFLIKFSYFGLK